MLTAVPETTPFLAKGPAKESRDQRRSPIGVTVIVLVLDGAQHLERVRDPVVQLRREVGEILIVAVDEAVDLGLAQVEAIIETIDRRAAARAEMGPIGSERIERSVEFVLDRRRWSAACVT